jgi:hypothetical protein
MASPSVTYTFTNGTTADANAVNQNFTDLISAMTDASKSFSIDALTVAGALTANGNIILGNAVGDTVTVNGTFTGTGGIVVPGTSPGLVSSTSSYVGYNLQDTYNATINAFSVADGTWTTDTGLSLTIEPGNWLIAYNICLQWVGGAGTATYALYCAIVDSDNVILEAPFQVGTQPTVTTGKFVRYSGIFSYDRTSTNKVIRAAVIRSLSGGTESGTPALLIRGDNADIDLGLCRLKKIRIA